jgi:ribosomal protein S11
MLKKIYIFKKKKNHFFFGKFLNKIGKIYIRRTFSNIFITLCDLKNKVITCQTSGSSDIYQNKRRKKISQAIEKIILKLNKFLKLYNISFLHIIFKIKIKSHAYMLLSKLIYYNINILSITLKRSIAHNGVKGKNLRRL